MSSVPAIKVLVLDDEPFMLRLTERMLRQLGVEQLSCFRERLPSALRNGSIGAPAGSDIARSEHARPGRREILRQLVERNFEGALILVSGEEEQVLQSVRIWCGLTG